jgi:hypothetical protein
LENINDFKHRNTWNVRTRIVPDGTIKWIDDAYPRDIEETFLDEQYEVIANMGRKAIVILKTSDLINIVHKTSFYTNVQASTATCKLKMLDFSHLRVWVFAQYCELYIQCRQFQFHRISNTLILVNSHFVQFFTYVHIWSRPLIWGSIDQLYKISFENNNFKLCHASFTF